MLAYDVTVDSAPLRDSYDTKNGAIKLVAKYIGVQPADVRSVAYTVDKPDHSGYVLAWRVARGRPLDLQVPDGFRLGQAGWKAVEDAKTITDWGL